jgi:ribosome biogenesis GTPase A
MAAGIRKLEKIAPLVDLVIEVRDARLPRSTAPARFPGRLAAKPRIIVLNRSDLADSIQTERWVQSLRRNGQTAFAMAATRPATVRPLRAALLSQPTRGPRLRIAVIGAPNTGKSSLINALARRKGAPAQNRPGVTRDTGWIVLDRRVELLDSPGVLEPAIRNPQTAWQFAVCGILPESAFDPEDAALHLCAWWQHHRPADAADPLDLESFARRRGMLTRGDELNRRNAAGALLREFRAGKLGRVTFERVDDTR